MTFCVTATKSMAILLVICFSRNLCYFSGDLSHSATAVQMWTQTHNPHDV